MLVWTDYEYVLPYVCSVYKHCFLCMCRMAWKTPFLSVLVCSIYIELCMYQLCIVRGRLPLQLFPRSILCEKICTGLWRRAFKIECIFMCVGKKAVKTSNLWAFEYDDTSMPYCMVFYYFAGVLGRLFLLKMEFCICILFFIREFV